MSRQENDNISRRAAIDDIQRDRDASVMPKMWHEGVDYAIDHLLDLPSAQPEATYEQVMEYCKKRCMSLVANEFLAYMFSPSAQPERKKGEWIQKPNIYGVAYCSECDYELHTDNTNYCPNCGADMRGEQDE